MKNILLAILILFSFSSFAQLRSAGTGSGNVVYSTSPTITTPSFTTGFQISGAAASGKIPIGNGTNYVASTPTYPNAASTTGKVIKSDGTNFITSTETYAAPSTSGNFLMSDGTNWIAQSTRHNWTSFVVSGSNATTTGQTLTDVTGLTSGTLSNSTLYEVEAWLNVTTSAVTTGCQYGIGTTGSGGASVVMAILVGNSTGTTMTMENLTGAGGTASTARLLTSAQSGMIYIHGWVTTRGSGTANLSIQHLKVTSGTSTVLIGSLFRYRLAN